MKIHSTRIYMADGCKSGTLTIEGKKIVAFAPGRDPEAVDYGDLRIIPGPFDTHNHGTCGFDPGHGETEEERKASVKGYLKGLASQGTVNIFPTVTPPEAIAAVAAVHDEGPQDGATILGIHSEGPWLNRVGEKGIKTGWPEVSLETAKAMVEAGHGLLRLVALAPEIPGIEAVMEYLLSQGVTLAYAHSDDTYDEAMESFGKGISVATHTGNVMSGLHHRNMGGLGACLLNENVECEVICDGLHIGGEMLRIFFRVKSPDRFMMISDCTHLSGAPVGHYDTPYGMPVNITPEGFVLSDTGRLMGSSQPVLYGISNLVEKLGVPMETVLKMACLNPAKKYGFEHDKGCLALGKDADLVVITDDYKAQATYAEGRLVYDRAKEGTIFNEECMKAFVKA